MTYKMKIKTKKQKNREIKLSRQIINVLAILVIISIIAAPWKPWYFLTAVLLILLIIVFSTYIGELNKKGD